MFNKIWSFITGEVRSVESIISGFASTVKALEYHAASKLEEVFKHEQTAAEATAAAALANVEAAKAQLVAGNIKTIIGA